MREAGPFQRVDLRGCDAIRPVTFSFNPILRVPEDDQGIERLVADFMDAGTRGVDVYQQTRVDLHMRLRPHGPMRLLEPVMRRKITRFLADLPGHIQRGLDTADARS